MSNKTNNFNIIRFVAALMVIAGHMAYLIGDNVPTLWGQGIQTVGVKIFFLLGGYFISKSWISDSCLLRYGIKRIFRIFPPLIVYILIMTFIIGPFLSEYTVGEYFSNPATYLYLKNIIMYPVYALPGVFTSNPYPNAINGSLWTLPIECFLYIIIPIIVALFSIKTEGKKSFFITTILTSIVCCFQIMHLLFFPEWRYVIWGNDVAQAFTLIPYYFLGMLFNFPCMKKILNIQIAVIIALIYACFNLSTAFNELMLYFILPYVIFSFGLIEKPFFAKIFNKYEFSYGLYLYGFSTQQIIVYFTGRKGINFTFAEHLTVSILITIIIALGSCILIEKPSQKLSKCICQKICFVQYKITDWWEKK